jgi:3'-5' exonuclease
MSLFRLLISDRVFKIGNAIKADLTRVKKQFPQLHRQQSFNIIDLKEYCVQRGVVRRNASGSLGILLEKTLGMYISKDEQYRKSEEWERTPLDASLRSYAALDVYACFLIFEKMILVSPIACIQFTTAPGTPVVLLTHEGGLPSAYGTIVDPQPSTYGSIMVKTPTKSRLLIEIHKILAPAAAVIFHRLPGHSASRTKSGALTLDQLQEVAGNEPLRVVAPISHLEFDKKMVVTVCKLFLEYHLVIILFLAIRFYVGSYNN